MDVLNLSVRVINNFYRISIVIVSICMMGAPVLADEDSKIINLYDQFNAELRRLNLAEPMSLIDEDKVMKAIRMLNKVDTSALSKFYTKAMVETDAKCYTASNCNLSNLISLSVITMSRYDVFAVNEINNESVELVIEGKTTLGTEIKLVLIWLLEDEQWKIDSTTKIPK